MERVVVTGAAGSIGSACVRAFQTAGTEVIGVDLVESSAPDDHLRMDIADPDCGHQLLRFLDGRAVDGLVNNAAVQLNEAAVDITASDFDDIYKVNLRAPLLLANALKALLADRRGFVVNVASVHAVATSQLVSTYAATKGGLVALTRALAIEWAPEIRVNAVLPGATESSMLVDGLSRTGSSLDALGSRHPLGRVGSPDEAADAVMFLARNPFVTGAALIIDGGATARLSTE